MRMRSSRSPLPTSAPGLRLAPAHVCVRTSAHPRVHLHRPLPSSAPRVAAHPCAQRRQGWGRARVRVDLFPRVGDSAPITRFVRGSVAAHSRFARGLRSRPRRPRRSHSSIGSEPHARANREQPVPAARLRGPRGVVGAPVPNYAALQRPIPTCSCGCAGACECGCEYAVWACSACALECSRCVICP